MLDVSRLKSTDAVPFVSVDISKVKPEMAPSMRFVLEVMEIPLIVAAALAAVSIGLPNDSPVTSALGLAPLFEVKVKLLAVPVAPVTTIL